MIKIATFGAGCFWGVEKAFKTKFKSAITASVGYAGGHVDNPTYEQICTGKTGHAEVVQVQYNPETVAYEQLVDFFYRMHEPYTPERQGNDRGSQYRSVIFYHDQEQEKIAKEVTAKARANYGKAVICTIIEPIGKYFKAEGYHQEYLLNNPSGYECATHFERSWENIINKFK